YTSDITRHDCHSCHHAIHDRYTHTHANYSDAVNGKAIDGMSQHATALGTRVMPDQDHSTDTEFQPGHHAVYPGLAADQYGSRINVGRNHIAKAAVRIVYVHFSSAAIERAGHSCVRSE